MQEIEKSILSAAADLVLCQKELLDMAQEKLKIHPYDYWLTQAEENCADEVQGFFSNFKKIDKRLVKQNGMSSDGNWMWFFHGLECDFFHQKDGRKLVVAFGSGGKIDTFNSWTLLQFIQNSKSPWKDYKDILKVLQPDPNQKISEIVDSLLEQGLLQEADPRLCQLVEKYTKINEDGFQEIAIPENEMPDYSFEISVCDRLQISDKGKALL